MSDRYGGALRQMPCPDCGSPVQPEREQLCPRCGYPLMFLRQNGNDDSAAKQVPRLPNERDDPTSLRAVPQQRHETRQFPGATYGAPPAAGQLQCRNCGYPNEQTRVRCERCGIELRQARPHARTLAPQVPQAQQRRGNLWWLIVLIVLAVLSMIVLAVTLLWRFLG